MGEGDTTTRTDPKTLWTETVLEMLFQALKKESPDKEVKMILIDARTNGCKPSYIIDKVNKKVGEEAALRVKTLMHK